MKRELHRTRYEDFRGGVDWGNSPLNPDGFPMLQNLMPYGKALRARFGWRSAGALANANVCAILGYGAGFFTIATNGEIRYYTPSLNNYNTVGSNVLCGTLPTATQNVGYCQMAMFGATCVITSIYDGLYTCTTAGASLALANATPKGVAIAVWQNKVWAAAGTRVWWSNAGSATAWTVGTDFVDIRDVDGQNITALGSGSGIDVIGRQSLNVFKATSWYKIYDSTTGANYTMSNADGASANCSVTSIGTTCYFANSRGIYEAKGAAEAKLVLSNTLLSPSNVPPYLARHGPNLMGWSNGEYRYWEYIPETKSFYPQYAQPGVQSLTGPSFQYPGAWGSEDALFVVNNSGVAQNLQLAPPGVDGVSNQNQITATPTMFDTGSAMTQAYLRLPAFGGGSGEKTRIRRVSVTGRLSSAGATYITPLVYATRGAENSGNEGIDGQSADQDTYSWNTTPFTSTNDHTKTWSQGEFGVVGEGMVGFAISGAPTRIEQTRSFMNPGSNAPTLYIPGVEIAQITLETIALGR